MTNVCSMVPKNSQANLRPISIPISSLFVLKVVSVFMVFG